MMQAGVCLRQDTDTTRPELTEQHRIRQKEEELSGLESVHMAGTETECAAPGLNTLEPECVTAHSGISDVHHAHTSLIKTENDLGSTHTGDLIKTESHDSTELGYVTHLHPDQIKTEADDGGYLKAEHISDLLDIKCVDIKSDQIKCESSECLVSDLKNSVKTGALDQTEPWQCAGELNPDCKKEEVQDLLTQCGDINYHSGTKDENNSTRVVWKSADGYREHEQCQRMTVAMEPVCKNSQLSNLLENETNDKHKGGIHTAEKPGKCIDSKNCSSTNNALKVPYKCTHCGECFSRLHHLSIHQRIHRGDKLHKCTQCLKFFKTNYDLNVHLREHTGEKPYSCSLCGKCFSQIGSLNRHQSIHTGEKPYKCTQCEKCFRRHVGLQLHLKIHTGEKPYKCTVCEKCFHDKGNLNRHQRVHTGEKPYTCPQCGKCFTHRGNLNTHQRIHTGEMSYKCIECGKCFAQSSALNAHKKCHTGDKPYTCSQCGKCFLTASHLHRHQRVHSDKKS